MRQKRVEFGGGWVCGIECDVQIPWLAFGVVVLCCGVVQDDVHRLTGENLEVVFFTRKEMSKGSILESRGQDEICRKVKIE